MKKIINLLLTSFIAAGLTACWSEDIPEAGASRRQVTDLTATPGDEEVLLAWNLPEGWNPTDFIVYYTDADSETVTLRTGGKMNCTVDGLVNGMQYTFYVQAVYGKLVSNYVTVLGRPATTRFPITDLTVDAGDSFVSLSWTKPATTVLSYTLSYYNEDAPDDIERQTLDKEATSVTLDGLTNDKNYYFSLAANYEKGASEPATAKAMPTLAIPYILDRDQAAKNQPITFTFNTEDYPTATDVRWTFPGEVVKEGTVVKYGLGTVGTQTVKLNATIDGNARSWTLEVEIREYVIYITVNPVTGDIYYGTQTPGHFYAVTSEGSLKWVFEEAGSMQSAAPAVNAAGTAVYICDKSGNTFAIDAASGQKIWNFTAGVPGGGLLVNGSELLIGAESNAFFVNIETGEQIAKVALGCKMSDITGFAVSSDKTLAYFGAASGYIGAVDLTTHTAKTPLLAGTTNPNTIYEPVVAPNGSIFAGSKNGSVYNVKGDLSAVNWEHVHTGKAVNNTYNYSHPCVDSENRFYITAGQTTNTSYIFDAEGRVLDSWSYTGTTAAAQRQMGGNNYLDGVFYSAFIGNGDQNGMFVGKYVGGERASSWSTHGGDICGSCCVK